MFLQWVLRLLGYGAAAVSGYATQKYGAEVGSAVALAAAAITNKATSYIIPRKGQSGS